MLFLLSAVRRVLQFFRRSPPRRNPLRGDDRLKECMEWIALHPGKKIYVACRLLSTVRELESMFPDAHVATVGRLVVGFHLTQMPISVVLQP